jgi:LCP family protein required for cell wall assembly
VIARLLRHALRVTAGFVIGSVALVGAWIGGVDVPIVSGRTAIDVVKLDHASFAGQADGVVFIALIGSDYRPTLGEGSILNIPRDTCAQVPGRGTSKINNAHSEGGPELAGAVLADLTGAPISYAVSVDFAGFVSIVDGVGGVEVDVPFEMSDHYSGAYFSPGVVHMGGRQALEFSRDRHDFGPGDIQRTWNQGYLMIAGIAKLRADYSSPSKRFELLALLQRHAKIHGATLSELFRLGQAAFDVDPAKIKSVTIPTSGGDCLRLGDGAEGLFSDFTDDGVLQSHDGGTPDNPTGR